ncbi:hypothetical protein ILUMI_22403 [Ignelater luminosus]|uniref:Peptidase S1 domain-containing protein n=1 Tax=Ignelater luminosus TaxID=2038154 RepID=A0A8K0G2N2_IGNLU|nr:hypothetical protein ILUMI_22403 [Ignelater luminosus]
MFRALLVFIFTFGPALVTSQTGQNDSIGERILGGNTARDGQYPYQVSIHLITQHVCGGSIISPQWILTAAHCILGFPPWYFVVHVGTNLATGAGGSSYQVIQISQHEKYIPDPIANDIALFKVAGNIAFNEKVQPIRLASTPPSLWSSCVLSGWGYLKVGGPGSDYLQYINLKLNQCKSFGTFVADDTQLCTAVLSGSGACSGDSGGPLVCKGVQYGIASFVLQECGAGYPDVYTNVAAYRQWITDKTGV